MQPFSVLMSVYRKERTDFLCASLESVFNQTVLPNEVVLVKDGPLTVELEEVIACFVAEHPELKVVPLPVNVGLGRALNEGLKHCSHELVARMDTDDICKPDRFEKQLRVFETQPQIDVCSAWLDEFDTDIQHVHSVKYLPETSEELYEYGKTRNPVNHPVVMFRKEAVIRSGSYQHYPLFEDYYLWVRMLVAGSKFYTIQEALLYFRASPDMFARRGGWAYALTEARLQFLLYGIRYINMRTFLENLIIRFFTRIMPPGIREKLYKKKLRTKESM